MQIFFQQNGIFFMFLKPKFSDFPEFHLAKFKFFSDLLENFSHFKLQVFATFICKNYNSV